LGNTGGKEERGDQSPCGKCDESPQDGYPFLMH
jgi:hypothetical protein